MEFQRNPRGYLYRAAVNAALDVLRGRRRRPVLVERIEHFDFAAPQSDSLRLEDLHQRLFAALDQLSPQAREIPILRYMHKKSIADIGSLLGVSRAGVSLRLFRSRAHVRKLLGISGDSHE